jgi:hypothetical protein
MEFEAFIFLFFVFLIFILYQQFLHINQKYVFWYTKGIMTSENPYP